MKLEPAPAAPQSPSTTHRLHSDLMPAPTSAAVANDVEMPSLQQDARNGRKARLSLSDSSVWEAAQRFWRKSYAGDYLGLVVIIVILVLVKLLDEPFHQMFRLNDPRIQHPHAEKERVGILLLCVYAAAIPLIVVLLWTLIYRPDIHKTHVTILGLASSILTTTLLTDVLKDAIGRPRPDLLARCKPGPSTPTAQLVTIAVCTETQHHLLHDGWRSFPSGHSSFAFAGLGWLALFLAAQTRGLRPRASLAVALLCLVPLLAAALIAISRLEDYRHDVFDVVAGSLLGFAVALFNWRRYYPSLLAADCDEPYSAPSGSGRQSPSGVAFQRVRDEEEGYGETDEFGLEEAVQRSREGSR